MSQPPCHKSKRSKLEKRRPTGLLLYIVMLYFNHTNKENNMDITQQVDDEISEALHEDEEYLKLTPEERIKVLQKLNSMLHHTLYEIGE